MVTESDFTNGPASDFGVTSRRTPVTVTINNITGHKEYSDGIPVNLTAVMENADKKYSFDKSGLSEGADARMFVIGSAELSKNDKITLNDITYRIDTVSTKFFGSNAIFKTVLLFETNSSNLVTNSNFEFSSGSPTSTQGATVDNWTLVYNGASGSGATMDTANTSSPLTGTKDLKLTNSAGENAGVVSNALSLVNGQNYNFSFNYSTNYDATTQTNPLRFKIANSNTSPSGSGIGTSGGYVGSDVLQATTRTRFSATFQYVDANETNYLTFFGDDGLIFQVDDIKFNKV